MKRARQAEILSIIQSQAVETQEQLLQALRSRGFTSTQATISRDIKELHLVKELSGGCYRYTAYPRPGADNSQGRLRNIFKEGVLSVDAAQNLVVIKTMPGLASAECSALDNMEIDGMIASLAGDDVGLLVMRDNAAAQAFSQNVHRLLK